MSLLIRRIWLLAVSTAFCTPLCAGILHVDDSAAGGGDGASWRTALNDLQAALDATGNPRNQVTEIRIAQGRYVPTFRTDVLDPRSATFVMRSALTIAGGFAGVGASDPDARDISAYTTSFDGDLNDDDGPAGSFINYADNAYHVVTASGTDATAALDGVTITAGSSCCIGGQFDPLRSGGGMYVLSGSPTLVYCTFAHNFAYKGGGLYVNNGSPRLIGCAFNGNKVEPGSLIAGDEGGGLYSIGGLPVLEHCTFAQNRGNRGGGMYHRNGTATLKDCTFTQNQATGNNAFGGGLYAITATINLSGCTFTGNSANGSGGALEASHQVVTTITDCIFAANTSSSGYGGAISTSSSPMTISYCAFASNRAADFNSGGAISIGGGLASISHCEFTSNGAELQGGAIRMAGAEAGSSITECTFHDNIAPFWGGGALELNGCTPTITRCTFKSNVTNGDGGAIEILGREAPMVVNCLFDDNAASIGHGGAVFNGGTGSKLVNCTLVDNTAWSGGAIYNQSAVVMDNRAYPETSFQPLSKMRHDRIPRGVR